MSLIVLPSARWTQKPPAGTDLDRQHAVCPDHCWPFLSPQGCAQVLTKGAPIPAPTSNIYTGTSSMVPGRKYGLSVRHAATSDATMLAPTGYADAIIPTGNGGFTMLLAYRKTDATARGTIAIGTGSGPGAGAAILYLPYAGTSVYWHFANSEWPITGLTFDDDLWTVTTGPRGMEVWQNGLLRLSRPTDLPSRSAQNTTFVMPGGGDVSDLADIALVMTWRRQLTVAEIIAMYGNPWQVFEPRKTFLIGIGTPPGTTVSIVGTGGVRVSGAAIITIPQRPVLTGTTTRLTYVEDAAATPVDPAIVVTDADSATIAGATVQITTGYLSAEDLLEFVSQLGITASWNSGTGTLTLTGTTTLANYQTALRAVTYRNTQTVTPTTAFRTVAFTVTDATSMTSAAKTRELLVVRRNDPPLVTGAGLVVYVEGDGPKVLNAAMTVLDEDTASLTWATVVITNNYRMGEDQLSVAGGSVAWAWNAATATLTLTGPASPAAMQAALRTVTYTNLRDGVSGLSQVRRTLVVTVSDT